MKSFLLLCLMITLMAGVSQAGEKTDDLVMVNLQSTLTELNDFRPGYIYLVVANKSDTLLNVDRIEIAEYPDFIDVKKSSLDSVVVSREKKSLFYPDKKTINAGESEVYEVFITASDQVKPGKHLLLFNVFYNGWGPSETQADSLSPKSSQSTLSVRVRHPMTGSVTQKHEVDVKVFGEGEILGALSNAVTFLMMPGFIMVIVFAMAWKISAPVSYQEKLPAWFKETKIADLQFWVIAITMSLIMARWLYPILTQLFTSGRRNYLYGYGFYDIVMMWGFSVLVGGFTGLLSGGLLSLYRKKKYHESIHGDENPLVLLQKAVDLGMKEAMLKKITIKSTGKSGYIVEQDAVDKDSLWVIPGIQVIWQAGADELNERFEQEIYDPKTKLAVLLGTLAEGERQKQAGKGLEAIDWEKNTQFVERPLVVKKADFDSCQDTENIFSFDTLGQ